MSMLLAPNQLRQMMAQYNILNAALFDGSTGYLNRVVSTTSDRQTWTYSAWILPVGSDGSLFNPYSAATDAGYTNLAYSSLYHFQLTAWAIGPVVVPNAVNRDSSGFVHVVIAVDTNQVTASDRLKIYLNGVLQTSFSASTYPTLSQLLAMNDATATHRMGARSNVLDSFFEGYIAELNFIDGQQLTALDFAELDLTTGNWIAKSYAGTYGTNGFYLDFSNGGALGTDASGNGNNWTVNGTVTQVTSTPTNTASNLNDLDMSGAALTNGNRTFGTVGSAAWREVRSSLAIPDTGKWECQITVDVIDSLQTMAIGVREVNRLIKQIHWWSASWAVATDGNNYGVSDGNLKCSNGTNSAFTTNMTVGDVFTLRFDADALTLEVLRNNVTLGLAWTGMAAVRYAFACSVYNTSKFTFAFDEADFTYAIGSGYSALQTDNLPAQTATEKDLSKLWKTMLYTGTASTQSITGVGFQSGFIWGKNRTSIGGHSISDACRGINKQVATHSTAAEYTATDNVISFDADGFSLGANTGLSPDVNFVSGNNYVAWCASLPNIKTSGWAGSPTITPSKEIYNTDLGMSIVTYTGVGGIATLPHSLGVKPGFMIFKNLSNSLGASDWDVYHKDVGATKYLSLNTTAAATVSSTRFNDTEPTATQITFAASYHTNNLGDSFVAYIFAESDFIKIGSYVGNGSADGPMVNTGTSVEWSMTKSSSNIGNWYINYDANGYNPDTSLLYADLSNADTAAGNVDKLSNGTKIRNIDASQNGSGYTICYMTIGQPI